MNYLERIASQLFEQAVVRGNRIVFPGGKNADTNESSASLTVTTRYNESINEVEYVIVPKIMTTYKPLVIEDLDHPEVPLATARRETQEETGIKVLACRKVAENPINDNVKIGKKHMQYGFWCYNYDDINMHKYPPLDGKTDVPFWVPASLLREYLWEKHHWLLDAVEAEILANKQLLLRVQGAPRKKLRAYG